MLGDLHPTDESRTSFHSQISSVFAHRAFIEHFAPGRDGDEPMEEFADVDTTIADYVWLPIRFDGDRPVIEWRDEWTIEEFDEGRIGSDRKDRARDDVDPQNRR